MGFKLPALPWAEEALAPHISANTIGFHYGKHHAAYVANLNKLAEGTPFVGMPLEEVIRESAGDGSRVGVFNAAQIWNHTFFWNSMRPGGGGEPSSDLMSKIDASFGSYDNFREQFATKAATLFGAGWTWLVAEGDKLDIVQTPNAGTPLIVEGQTPLLTLDVWEHAYYLDYQNRRPDFIKTFLDHLVNWDFAEANLANG
jgi:Fe-Mn family superoxide dismutase